MRSRWSLSKRCSRSAYQPNQVRAGKYEVRAGHPLTLGEGLGPAFSSLMASCSMPPASLAMPAINSRADESRSVVEKTHVDYRQEVCGDGPAK